MSLNAVSFTPPKDRKLRVGFYGITGCAGCQLSAIFNEDEILELLSHVDLRAFPLIRERNYEDNLDVVFMEGLVACQEDIDTLKRIREKTKFLIELGTCASTGCIPAYRYFTSKKDYEHLLYRKRDSISDMEPSPLHAHVIIDYTVPGCPPDRGEIVRLIIGLAKGRVPLPYTDPVCVECRRNKNLCLLEENKLCLGPITNGGCNSICINGGLECWGCRGNINDSNPEALVNLLKEKGFSDETIKQQIRAFAAWEEIAGKKAKK